MFRIDNDHVIDATLTGGPARWVALEGSLTSSRGIPRVGLGLLEALSLWGLFSQLVHSVFKLSHCLFHQLYSSFSYISWQLGRKEFFLILDFFDIF